MAVIIIIWEGSTFSFGNFSRLWLEHGFGPKVNIFWPENPFLCYGTDIFVKGALVALSVHSAGWARDNSTFKCIFSMINNLRNHIL